MVVVNFSSGMNLSKVDGSDFVGLQIIFGNTRSLFPELYLYWINIII